MSGSRQPVLLLRQQAFVSPSCPLIQSRRPCKSRHMLQCRRNNAKNRVPAKSSHGDYVAKCGVDDHGLTHPFGRRQVTGKFSAVVDKIRMVGPFALWNGSIAAAGATFVGHYPWFFTYNLLSEKIPRQETQLAELGRRALIGFCASAVSDTCSNSIRVVKVYKQSYPEQISYPQVVQAVIKESGVRGLFFRGLETKILANGLQGLLFSILWKQFEEAFFGK